MKWSIHRQASGCVFERALYFCFRKVQLIRNFSSRWDALKFLLEVNSSFFNLIDIANFVQRKSNNTRLLCNRLQNGLANPPYCIGNKFKTTGFIKAFCCFYKTHITFVNKVWEAKSLVLVLFSYGNHKSQVATTQLVQGFLNAFSYALGQLHFLFGCN